MVNIWKSSFCGEFKASMKVLGEIKMTSLSTFHLLAELQLKRRRGKKQKNKTNIYKTNIYTIFFYVKNL